MGARGRGICMRRNNAGALVDLRYCTVQVSLTPLILLLDNRLRLHDT